MSQENLKSEILGIWQLKSKIDTDSSGNRSIDPVLGADPLGVLCFSQNYFAAQFMKRDRSVAPISPQMVQGSNNSNAQNGYDAYFGSYSLDYTSGTLKIQLEGAISPSNIGSKFERNIQVRDNELIITLSTNSVDGSPITRILTFLRLP